MNSNLEYLKYEMDTSRNLVLKYNTNIEKLVEEIETILTELREDNGDCDFNKINSMNSIIPNYSSGLLFDYSVNWNDLKNYSSITLSDGNTYTIYSCNKTGSLYIISDIQDNHTLKKEMFVALKDKINNDQMVIVTFDNEPFHYNVYDITNSSNKFGFVAKNSDGKAICYHNYNANEKIYTKCKMPWKEAIVSYKGFVMPSHGAISVENNAQFDMVTKYQYEANQTDGHVLQGGLKTCSLFVQELEGGSLKGISTQSKFIPNDPVLSQAYDSGNKDRQQVLDAHNANFFHQSDPRNRSNRYYTIFNEVTNNYETEKKNYTNYGSFLGTHDSTFSLTLYTDANKIIDENYVFTLTGITYSGGDGSKQMWSTTHSHCVDDWKDISVL